MGTLNPGPSPSQVSGYTAQGWEHSSSLPAQAGKQEAASTLPGGGAAKLPGRWAAFQTISPSGYSRDKPPASRTLPHPVSSMLPVVSWGAQPAGQWMSACHSPQSCLAVSQARNFWKPMWSRESVILGHTGRLHPFLKDIPERPQLPVPHSWCPFYI